MIRIGIACIALLVGVSAVLLVRHSRLEGALIRAWPDEVLKDPGLRRYALSVAPPVYRQRCASCHGNTLRGNSAAGVPNLADQVWLYGDGSVSSIETTILYGIRSGHPRAHNLTDMPGFSRTLQLTDQDMHDAVEYVLQISGQAHEDSSAARGRAIFLGPGVCYDCHAGDAEGVSDYGTPALTGRGGAWLYGGDRATLYKSVRDGRHGKCPAWIGVLSFAQIRALAVYLHEYSHHD